MIVFRPKVCSSRREFVLTAIIRAHRDVDTAYVYCDKPLSLAVREGRQIAASQEQA